MNVVFQLYYLHRMTLDQLFLLVCLHILTNFSPKTKTQELDSWFMFALYLWKNRYFVHWQPANGRQYYSSDAGAYSTEPDDFKWRLQQLEEQKKPKPPPATPPKSADVTPGTAASPQPIPRYASYSPAKVGGCPPAEIAIHLPR